MKIRLYHTSFDKIPVPDLKRGRANADFGQGFYTTEDQAFSVRWATYRKGQETYVNAYELDLSGLEVRKLTRDREWFEYIRGNRSLVPDTMPTADIIVGPIANDTIYNTMGILTSGLVGPEEALQVLLQGPEYTQVVIKSERAVAQLTWLGAQVLEPSGIAESRAALAVEEKQFQEIMAQVLVQGEE